MPDIWGFAAILTKFTLYLGVFTAAGTVFAGLLFRLEHSRAFCLIFAGIGICAAVLGFAVQGANLTGDIAGMTDPEMLGLLWRTAVGTALVCCVGGLGLLVLGVVIRWFWLAGVGAVLAVGSFTQVGHIADDDGFLLQIVLAVHLIAIALWIGILTPLLRLASHRDDWAEAARVGQRFGQIAAVTVPMLIIAGGYMAYVFLGSWGALLGTAYGVAMIIKVLLVACLLTLAAVNKLRFVPGLLAGDPTAARHLVTSIRAEWALVCAILLVTAVLTSVLTLPR